MKKPLSKAKLKQLRQKWTNILSISISLIALVSSIIANVVAQQGNDLFERANQLAEGANITAQKAYTALLPAPKVEQLSEYTITTNLTESPCIQQDGFARWQTEFVIVFLVKNDGGRSISLRSLQPKYTQEIEQHVTGKLYEDYFSSPSDFLLWASRIQPNNFWQDHLANSVSFSGYFVSIPPGDPRLLVLRFNETILVDPNVPRREITDKLLNVDWFATFDFIFNFSDEYFDGTIHVPVKMYSPSIHIYNASGNFSSCP